MRPMSEQGSNRGFADLLRITEVIIYYVVALLLSATALAAVASAGRVLCEGLSHWTIATETLQVLDQLLIVLMLVEILHTESPSARIFCWPPNRSWSWV